MGDTRGDDYAARLNRIQRARWKEVLDVQAPYRWHLRRQGLGRTLDIGCGIGRNLAALSPDSLGVDHNVAAVREACERGFRALTTTEWEVSDERVPQSFDSLLFAHVIEHMDEPTAVELVREYLPYLRPGGLVFFICPQERGYDSDTTHVRFVDLDGLAALAHQVGLEVVSARSFPFPRSAGKLFVYNEFTLLARAGASAAP